MKGGSPVANIEKQISKLMEEIEKKEPKLQAKVNELEEKKSKLAELQNQLRRDKIFEIGNEIEKVIDINSVAVSELGQMVLIGQAMKNSSQDISDVFDKLDPVLLQSYFKEFSYKIKQKVKKEVGEESQAIEPTSDAGINTPTYDKFINE